VRGMTRRWQRAFVLLAVLAIVAAACGDDDDTGTGGGTADTTEDTTEGVAGGVFIDGGTFVGGPPEHLDPALNSTLDAYQVVNALYDGLTDIDASDPENPEVKPHVAESYEANDDASVWTFKIREDAAFSNGEPILPSTFQKSWERASHPDFAGDYSYLFTFIEGGAEKLDGTADTIAGVEADDESLTLTVTLAEPYSNFDAVAGFQLFFPMPDEATEADPATYGDYENGIMIGNGPYMMEAPRNDQEIILVKNESWTGDVNGETWPDRLDRIEFLTQTDPDTSFNAMLAGETFNANIPPGRVTEAEQHGNTLDVQILGSYHFLFNERDERVGGDENRLLRQAISQAIDRDEINEAVYEGTRTTSTGITPPGIPGFTENICEYCAYDPEAAQAAFDEWVAEGNSLDGPLPIQFNTGAGHEDVVQIMIDNLAAIGIEAVAEGIDSETYFSQLADGACVICRAGWYADYPTYDNFMFDLFHSSSLDGNNFGFIDEEFDALVEEAKRTVDRDEQARLFQDAERRLLNEEIMAIPINWYRGDYVYDETKVANFPQTNFGLIMWEQIQLTS
jgi:oligopeptide transport system substrate-binding protein